jgi:hypothetical protein
MLRPKQNLIIDFGASFEHTHHSRVIQGFIELSQDASNDIKIFLPFASEIKLPPGNFIVFKKLIPSYHPVSFKFTLKSTWIPSSIGFLFKISHRFKLQRIISKLIKWITILHTFFLIKKIIKVNYETSIIFPTACPMAFFLGKFLERCHLKIILIYRLTNTAENRTFYSNNYNLNNYLEYLSKTKHVRVKFSYEMIEYRKLLNKKIKFFHSPTPSIIKFKDGEKPVEIIKIGILGISQKNKGDINNLINIIYDMHKWEKNNIQWVIQCNSEFFNRFSKITLNSQIQLIEGKISESRMQQELDFLDLMYLPYDAAAYTTNASAMVYRAADNQIPVITFKHSAFAREIDEHKIGFAIDDQENLFPCISFYINHRRFFNENITKYNNFRNHLNRELILSENYS